MPFKIPSSDGKEFKEVSLEEASVWLNNQFKNTLLPKQKDASLVFFKFIPLNFTVDPNNNNFLNQNNNNFLTEAKKLFIGEPPKIGALETAARYGHFEPFAKLLEWFLLQFPEENANKTLFDNLENFARSNVASGELILKTLKNVTDMKKKTALNLHLKQLDEYIKEYSIDITNRAGKLVDPIISQLKLLSTVAEIKRIPQESLDKLDVILKQFKRVEDWETIIQQKIEQLKAKYDECINLGIEDTNPILQSINAFKEIDNFQLKKIITDHFFSEESFLRKITTIPLTMRFRNPFSSFENSRFKNLVLDLDLIEKTLPEMIEAKQKVNRDLIQQRNRNFSPNQTNINVVQQDLRPRDKDSRDTAVKNNNK
ncbi:MAG: hypothetical protein H0W64_12285 [Gammaproteobacteria bacterium]|nr:hypothetical protein [Gammaproteobacteria bacterium]